MASPTTVTIFGMLPLDFGCVTRPYSMLAFPSILCACISTSTSDCMDQNRDLRSGLVQCPFVHDGRYAAVTSPHNE